MPDRAPSRVELSQAIERLRADYPGVLIDAPAHVLLESGEHRRSGEDCRGHVCTTPLFGAPFYRLGEGVLVACPGLSLVQVARDKSDVELLMLAYELCGTYQTKLTGVDAAYDVAPLACVRDLHRFVDRNRGVRGARRVGRILRYVSDGSASPRESKQAIVLGLPHMYGGYGLGVPRMNHLVRASAAARALAGKSFFRCDLCWPEAKLDVEYQSRWAHEGEASRLADSRRTNALMAMGWTVVGVTNEELDSLAATDAIANTIRRHLGKRAQVRVDDHHARKLRLRRQLGLPVGYA